MPCINQTLSAKQLHAPTHLFNALQPIHPPSAICCKKPLCQSIPLHVLSRSFQVNIAQSLKPFINPWAQSVLVLQLCGFMDLLVVHVNIMISWVYGLMHLSNHNNIYIYIYTYIYILPHYFTDASNRCMVASNRCTIFCQSIILKAVMNKVSLNVLCLSLSFHLCPGVLSSPSFNPSIPQPITLVQSPVRPSALYQSNPLSQATACTNPFV